MKYSNKEEHNRLMEKVFTKGFLDVFSGTMTLCRMEDRAAEIDELGENLAELIATYNPKTLFCGLTIMLLSVMNNWEMIEIIEMIEKMEELNGREDKS